MAKYKITMHGSEDSTEVEMELTTQEVEAIGRLQERLAQRALGSYCTSTMSIHREVTRQVTQTVWEEV